MGRPKGWCLSFLMLLVVQPVRSSLGEAALPGPGPPPSLSHPVSGDSLAARQRAIRMILALHETPSPADEVLAVLDQVAETIPGDDLVAGHRVGLRVMLGDLAGARAVAGACGASAWWCATLRGLVLHITGEFADAEAAYDEAFERMPFLERCGWTEDLHMILTGALARRMRSASCLERILLERRIWWMADPLYLDPGNDRKTEHLSRLVAMRLHHEYLNPATATTQGRSGPAPRGTICGPHHRLLITQGWESWGHPYQGGTTAASGGYEFIPDGMVMEDPFGSIAADWDLTPSEDGVHYAPPYGPLWDDLDPQAAFFRRGDSLAVVAGVELTGHPLSVRGLMDAGLILTRDEDDVATVALERGLDDRFVFRATVPAAPYVVGVEVLTNGMGAGRARFGHAAPAEGTEGLVVSDLLLFDWSAEIEENLDAVAPTMLGTSRVERDRHVGIFWELYGLGDGTTIEVAVTATPKLGLLGRMAAAFGITDPEGLRIAWQEPAAEGRNGRLGRSIEVDLSSLSPGPYDLALDVGTADGRTATARRAIDVW